MVSLNKYYLWFFLLCLGLTLVAGVLAALLPQEVAGIVTALPYLLAMIFVLYKFLNDQKRAPTDQERKKMTLIYTLIFWGYNFAGVLLGVYLFSRSDPQVWQIFTASMQNTRFLSLSVIMIMLLAIPLYLITYWFYGPQAKRMAKKKFGHVE
ncbi:ABZJ_00895 family protein [Acinetobacter shaoyimingii]|uniref:MFS transporter n=1 Tax=Acinetobacter shaoyimingii TaxID=2715164 RepID=A0A6G8RTW1_9GAMM|nr:ABZJ_00895 family protein [Acinetobacter shaoyimingii]NHB58837.1 hypothetical protein [Acinetobacter shaoyimingii]QIO05228.1 hypothetical protein G8E00_04235 [Acinetobacter shaoyimingii]